MKKFAALTSLFRFAVPLFALLAVWTFFVYVVHVDAYLLPSPPEVWNRVSALWSEGILEKNILATLAVVLFGFSVGCIFALVLGVLVARSRILANQLLPVIVGMQSVPLVAFAPLFLLWFGGGYTAKITVTALIVLFPVFTGTVEGFKKESLAFSRLFYSLGAARLDRWFLLRLPVAVPSVYAGIKTAIPLALVGAVVGEFLGTDVGLGFLIQSSMGLFDAPLMIGVLIILALMGVAFYCVATLVENIFLQKYFHAA